MDEIYTSIEDAPLDEYTTSDEGDLETVDAPHQVSPEHKVNFEAQRDLHSAEKHMRGSAPRSVKPTKAIIPFGRQLRVGSRGRDVIAVKRALARIGYGKLGSAAVNAPVFGIWARANLKLFQKNNGIAASGVYGVNTHAKLGVHFDDYSFFLYCGYKRGQTKEQRARAAKVAAAIYYYNTRDRVHYTQGYQRMQIVRQKIRIPTVPPNKDIYEDCSSFDTGTSWEGGCPDPNNFNFNGLGFTGTECVNGHSVLLEKAKPGDSVFYGHGPPWGHVAIYIGFGRVISHGSEVGPSLRLIDYDRGSLGGRGDIRSYF